MVLEIAQLRIALGQTQAFEAAFEKARPIIASMPGHLGHELQRCIENDHEYMLLVRWQTLEDHTLGFRGSAAYVEWKALLHRFYEPTPVVLHYRLVESSAAPP